MNSLKRVTTLFGNINTALRCRNVLWCFFKSLCGNLADILFAISICRYHKLVHREIVHFKLSRDLLVFYRNLLRVAERVREVDYLWRPPYLLVNWNCLQVNILQVVGERTSSLKRTSFVDELCLEFWRLVIFNNLIGPLHLFWVTNQSLVIIDDWIVHLARGHLLRSKWVLRLNDIQNRVYSLLNLFR